MAKNFRKKNYKRNKNILNSTKKYKQKKLNKSHDDGKSRKFKYIQRSKEAEAIQKRQKIMEDKYKKKDNPQQIQSDDDSEEENPYEALLSVVSTHKKDVDKAIESSSDSETESMIPNNNSDYSDKGFEITTDQNEIGDEDFTDEDDEENENEGSDLEKSLEQQLIEDETHSPNSKNVESEEENESEDESSDEDEIGQELEDPFSVHLDKNLAQSHLNNLLQKPPKTNVHSISWPVLGTLKVEISDSCKVINHHSKKGNSKKLKLLNDDEEFAREGKIPILIKYATLDLANHSVKNQLVTNILELKPNQLTLSEFQCELFSIINNYQDLYFSQRNFNNAEEIRYIYCLHMLNHMLKTRSRIIHHNAKLSSDKTKKLIPDSYRDQGLLRPKILIVLPFKSSCFKTVEIIISLIFGAKSETARKDGSVKNYKRFLDEFTGDTIKFPKKNPKPEDYEKIFEGNTDDSFRLGICLTKKSIKLYQNFYASDIIIASPLGLRMIVGAPGDADREFDFLNSIEILILDQVELFFAQNWDHFIHVMDHMHLQPQSVENTDFSRVRQWCLDGLNQYYRQTLLFMSHELPEFRSLFNNKCCNYRGKVKIVNPIEIGTIRNVVTNISQVFYKIDVTSIQSSFDARFKYFTTEILPKYKSPSMAHCMIYVPSYFDFVRIRNYMKSEGLNFGQICEYTKENKIARARDMFFHSAVHFLLYSERGHFYKRMRVKGIRHLIFYQPPFWPNLYPEMVNLMQEGYQNPRDGLETSMSITVLYTKYDILHVSNIIGTKKAAEILGSNKPTHLITTVNK